MASSLLAIFIWLAAATQVLAQSPPGPACAVACLGTVASSDGCQGVDDVQCICVVAGIFQQAANCVDQQCATTDFAAASTYLQAFCAGVSVIESATAFSLSSVPASAVSTAASATSSAAESRGSSAAASAASSAAASASGRASSAASAISSAVTSVAPSLSSVGASFSNAVSASIASASASIASASAASAAAASDASAAACPTSSSSAAEMYSHGALGWAVVALAVAMGFEFAAVL